jgi:hypothetical protein
VPAGRPKMFDRKCYLEVMAGMSSEKNWREIRLHQWAGKSFAIFAGKLYLKVGGKVIQKIWREKSCLKILAGKSSEAMGGKVIFCGKVI